MKRLINLPVKETPLLATARVKMGEKGAFINRIYVL